ncbi:MAG TPA: LuxR C-terminal-related transcriptional regulator [Ktedonobacteraceae bacterium]|jgi:hypothetical protein
MTLETMRFFFTTVDQVKLWLACGELDRAIHWAEKLDLQEQQGASNQVIAQKLVIAIDTVKRHVSHIFSKLGVQNRVQAVRQVQELSLLSE